MLGLLAVFIAVVAVGCGSSSDSSTAPDPSTAGEAQPEPAAEHARYVAAAEAICRHSLGEVHALAKDLAEGLNSAPTPETGVTDSLVKPGTEIIARQGAKLRALTPRPDSVALETYLGMFDPILALAYQRLEAGEAHDPARSRELEILIADLAGEQSAAARSFGLRVCSVGFTEALAGNA